jgi:hypothetical protein
VSKSDAFLSALELNAQSDMHREQLAEIALHGGKWMYMRGPAETAAPINELVYTPDLPEPPTLAEIAHRPIVLPVEFVGLWPGFI